MPHIPTIGLPLLDQVQQSPQEECEARGWIWDASNNSCNNPDVQPVPEGLLPQPEPIPTPEPIQERITPTREGLGAGGTITEEIRTQAGGALGLTDTQRADAAISAGVQQSAALQIQQRAAAEQQLLQQIGNIGKVGGLTGVEEAGINFSQAFTAGIARVAPAAAGGAAVGAAAGAVTTGGLASIPAAALAGGAAAIGGFISGVLSNIKEQQSGEIAAAKTELTDGLRQMRQLAMLASRDPANADRYIELYNDQLTRIHQSRRQLKAEVSGDLNAFMEDGREDLAKFDSFLRPGGLAETYGFKLEASLSSGIPLSIIGDELT